MLQSSSNSSSSHGVLAVCSNVISSYLALAESISSVLDVSCFRSF